MYDLVVDCVRVLKTEPIKVGNHSFWQYNDWGRLASAPNFSNLPERVDTETLQQKEWITMIVPQELRNLQQWVCWRRIERDGKPAKVPFTPEGKPASVSDPNTWTDFQTALNAYHRGSFNGIGFVLTTEAGIVCVDIDDVTTFEWWDPKGWLKPEAMEMVRLMNSYTEVSPSGQGLHIWCYGHLPAGRRRKNGVEMYDSGRFITVTGKHLEGTPMDLQERTAELNQLYQQVFGDISVNGNCQELSVCNTDNLLELEDQELLEKAMNAENGAKFRALWHGDTTGYHSQSEADLALCRLLAFWCGNDPERIERLFSQSALGQREKWRTRGDYRHQTIQTALQSLRETYTGGHGNGHRQKPHRLRQIDRTDAETEGTGNPLGNPESHAIDEPGATGAGSRNGHGQSPFPNPFPAGEGDADLDDIEIPEAIPIRPSPHPLPEGKGDDADTVGGAARSNEAAARTNGEAATPPLCTHEAKKEEASSSVSPSETDSFLSLYSNISTCAKGEAFCQELLHPDEAFVSGTAALDVRHGRRNEAFDVTKGCGFEASAGDSVAEQILTFAAGCSDGFTFAELSRSISASSSAVRSALYRLIRSGKLERRGRAYSLPSSLPDRRITSADEYADRLGISHAAARQRLSRMVRDGKAIRLGTGTYLLLGEGWRIQVVQWSDPERDDRGREYVHLLSIVDGSDVSRFYLNPRRLEALAASSAGFAGNVQRAACVILSPVRRGRREFWDCVGILSSDRSRILWLQSDSDHGEEDECADDDTVSIRDFAARNGISEKAARLRLMRMVRDRRAVRVKRGRYLILPGGWKVYEASFKQVDRTDGNIIVQFELDDGRQLRTYDTMAKRRAFLRALGLRDGERIAMGSDIHICVAEKLKRGRRVYDLVGVLSQDLRIIYRADIRQDLDLD